MGYRLEENICNSSTDKELALKYERNSYENKKEPVQFKTLQCDWIWTDNTPKKANKIINRCSILLVFREINLEGRHHHTHMISSHWQNLKV